VTEPEFWEITDRGVNFDYLDPALRPPLRAFLQQLPVFSNPTGVNTCAGKDSSECPTLS